MNLVRCRRTTMMLAVIALLALSCTATFAMLSAAPAQARSAAVRAQSWSSRATWAGRGVPRDGARVVIPHGKVVVLDRNVRLRSLTVNGTLVFARRDLVLQTDWIMVHGVLQIGSPTRPFTHRAVIRITDRARGENVMDMGDKLIGVMGGRVEMYGARRLSWTRLAATAQRGSTRLVLGRAAGWKRGDQLVVSSTDFAQDQAEQVTVRGVSGRTVYLTRPLQYQHFGVVQTIAGRMLDERAEVGLLTRNITITGDATTDATRVGAQMMAMDGGVIRLDGVELTRVGQLGRLRRYPIHFHMLGNAGARSFVRHTSIHDSDNRCLTIHATNRVRVTDNVCYDHFGHGIFMEDGAERDNAVIGNLVLGTRTPPRNRQLLESDDSPASYWITNPANTVRANVAAGSEGFGFWIALPEHPTGYYAYLHPAAARATWPRRMALTEFRGNVSHSNDQDGLHFDNGPRPDGSTETTHHEAHVNPADADSRTLITQLIGFRSYKNRGYGTWLRGTQHRLVNAVLADNGSGAAFASDESFMADSFVVGESANRGTPADWEIEEGGVGRDGRSLPRPWDAEYPVRGFEFYDGRVGAMRTTFANFQPWRTAEGTVVEQSALAYHLQNDFTIHPRNLVTGARFVNAKRVYLQSPQVGHDGDVSAVFVDLDGSVTGTAGRSVMTRNPFLFGTSCAASSDWNAQVCDGNYATLWLGTPRTSALRPVQLERADGTKQTLHASTDDDATDATTSILTETAYHATFNGGTPDRVTVVLWRGAGHWTSVSVTRGSDFRVMRYGCDVGRPGTWCSAQYSSLAALNAGTRSGYYYDDLGDADPTTGTLHLRLVSGADTDWDELEVVPK